MYFVPTENTGMKKSEKPAVLLGQLMGGVVAAALTGEDQRRQQDLRYAQADDQHLRTVGA
jgi:hypothetical protein